MTYHRSASRNFRKYVSRELGHRIFHQSGFISFALLNGLERVAYDGLTDNLIYRSIVSGPMMNSPLYCSVHQLNVLEDEKKILENKLKQVQAHMTKCTGSGVISDIALRSNNNYLLLKDKISALLAMKNDVQKEIDFTRNRSFFKNFTLKNAKGFVLDKVNKVNRVLKSNVTRRNFN